MKTLQDLNWFCKECLCLGNDCKGSNDRVYSNCIYRKTWVDRGCKVITKYGIGEIIDYLYMTQDYIVILNKKDVCTKMLFKKSEMKSYNN